MPWPGEIESVAVIWMDGQQETYSCNKARIDDGVLKLCMFFKGSLGFPDQVSKERELPLVNIRSYVINRVGL